MDSSLGSAFAWYTVHGSNCGSNPPLAGANKLFLYIPFLIDSNLIVRDSQKRTTLFD